MKSERLKKLEMELTDLQQWKNLGLVPKKDIKKHDDEIRAVKAKIEEEKERLRFLKESGEPEEYTAPKRTAQKQPFTEPQAVPEMDIGIEPVADIGMELEEEEFEEEAPLAEEEPVVSEEIIIEEEEIEDPFSDRNRWKRGIWEDPDADNW